MDETELNFNEQQRVRRGKLAELHEKGMDPYPARLPRERTHTAVEAVAAYREGRLAEGELVTLVGRMLTLRVMGKAAFAHIEDGSSRIQIYVKRDVVGEATYEETFKRLIDLGDFITVTGTMFTTRTGEVTCEVRELALIGKTLNPMPDKWHGLRDTETRYRQRYVDLLANPEVRDVFRTRARIVKAVRRYLDDNGFLEVETPVLQPIYGGAAARPFVTHHNQLDQDLFLRISFELYLKRLLVGGYERVYEIGRDFRNEGISFKHNPEFTQLEWYEAYTDYNGVMKRVEELLAAIATELNGQPKLHVRRPRNRPDPALAPDHHARRHSRGHGHRLRPVSRRGGPGRGDQGSRARLRPKGQPGEAHRRFVQRACRTEADPADLHHGLPAGNQPAGEKDAA